MRRRHSIFHPPKVVWEGDIESSEDDTGQKARVIFGFCVGYQRTIRANLTDLEDPTKRLRPMFVVECCEKDTLGGVRWVLATPEARLRAIENYALHLSGQLLTEEQEADQAKIGRCLQSERLFKHNKDYAYTSVVPTCAEPYQIQFIAAAEAIDVGSETANEEFARVYREFLERPEPEEESEETPSSANVTVWERLDTEEAAAE